MINANEARECTAMNRTDSINGLLAAVDDLVRKAMNAGRYGTVVNGAVVPQHLHTEFKARLQALGYEVEHYTGDQREPADQWNISWRKAVQS